MYRLSCGARVLAGTILGLFLFLFDASPASAQDSGRLGVSIGYPANIALLWQLSTRVALRPELTVDLASSETTATSPFGVDTFSSESWNVGLGLSALLFVHRSDNLGVYVSPRYMHNLGKNTTTVTSAPNVVVGGPGDRDTTGHAVSGAVGAHYTLGPRFGVFGEVGVSHARDRMSRESGPTPETEFRFRSTGVRSGVGIVFFF
jgi:hypothetical protein